MALVRPTDLSTTIASINSICDQLERQARGETPIVENPKVLGSWLQANGVTLGKLSTSFTDAPPGYVVASGSFTSSVSSAATTEATAVQVVAASSFTADGSRPVVVVFYAPEWTFTGAAGKNDNFISLYDGSTPLGIVARNTIPTAGDFAGPVSVETTVTPSAGAHTLSMRLWTSGGAGATARVDAGVGGATFVLPGLIQVSVR